MPKCSLIFIAALVVWYSAPADAHLEYAARYNINSCTACHLSPSGGGARTVDGKLFGAHGYAMNPWLAQDYVSADFRMLFYEPANTGKSKDGMGIMSASFAGHAALDEDHRYHLVIDYNGAGFGGAAFRDTYAMIKFTPEGRAAAAESLLFGRFHPPFGIVTDEHRTYTRIQTGTEWYTVETGAMLSGSLAREAHYDLALVNGEDSTGEHLTTGQSQSWGSVANLRWMPGWTLLGLSGSYHDHAPQHGSSRAASLYSVVSIARATNDHVPLELQLEYVRAWGWDENLGHGFAANPQYVQSLTTARSDAWLVWLDWWLSAHFALTYKFDALTPDCAFPADYYTRHGIGLKWFFAPGAILQVRTEFARATPPSEAGSTAEGAQNATFAVLQVSL